MESMTLIQRVVSVIAGSVSYASRLCFSESGLVVKAYAPSGTRVLPVGAGVGSFRIYCS